MSGTHCNNYTHIHVTNDDFAKAGNVFNETRCALPSPNVYWRGRFSNGPNWVDHLARMAAARNRSSPVTVVNYAYGGSTACRLGGIARAVPNLAEQISSYLDGQPSASADNGTATVAPAAAATTTANTTTDDGSSSCMPLQPMPAAAAFNDSFQSCRPAGRLYFVFIGHNDLILLNSKDIADPRVTERTAANITACTAAALEQLMAALSPKQQPSPQPPTTNASAGAGAYAAGAAASPLARGSAGGGGDDGAAIATSGNAAMYDNGKGGDERHVGEVDVKGATNARVTAASNLHRSPRKRALLAAPAVGGAGGGGCHVRDRVMVWGLAPVNLAPLVPDAARPAVAAAVAAHKSALETSLETLRRRYPSGPSLELYDVNASIAAGLAAAKDGFNTTGRCVLRPTAAQVATSAERADVCSHPEHLLSFDGLHPTTAAHLQLVAQPLAKHLGWL
ncbi:hypothetical protein VOLCADRAFT_90940 [Volvox carteri f. nagariensis]|uniref:Uncharacterized protein n=1 Tax=Volvox carteri f. nagariensis TaxID=3068 RepID=D8TVS4_VOLCA|nr:uncharacterized protein VOLCADRAFT_90940 [Volvox carteri f. nagariensis]EFJ48354.1 hypothetical protein VOLCADRAFT_90940 [Volvox carteri f. nagariensis]|eukprot:XP_002950608.1 hypothetical protein VOLCADRAFT_90940 [Volvox carteri f. nagariensis]